MLAIEARTGKYRWHFQQVHHDIWDYDAVNPVVLMDVRMGGRMRKAIVEVGKTGFAYPHPRERRPHLHAVRRTQPGDPRTRHLGRRELAAQLL
jgi:glucose dehydrogenase